ncbi:hypothetical protein LAG90_07220 [Marinilongibacter aquaticus]|uniref:MbnP family protein n=1 Tax=Marinilongibacter aquaticus TaxID=2975157 RepID=UPI0021BD9108|nr:MbnP family protein [Marinilongibacter aquaticus]UBM60433.1 hypothetical protein LAG90_07220 [Marinilongibacter aquaticus]
MKNSSKLLVVSLLLGVFFLNSCDKEENVDASGSNSVFVEFDNRAGLDKIVLGQTEITNTAGEVYTVSRLNYFVSNLKLTSSDGQVIEFPDQYFLIKEEDENSQVIELKDVPGGDYAQISFMIGVDSLKSVTDVSERTGVLDPASYGDDNMWWAWNSGYIFFKMEGSSAAIVKDNPEDKDFKYHIGGFGGYEAATANNLRTVSLNMDQMATVNAEIAPEVHMIFDLKTVMDGPNTLSLNEMPVRMSPASGIVVADNYKTGFVVDHVHNDHHAE